jgi:hypothetical protein
VPTVATRRAVRGIAGIPENCVIADDPARFASALTAAARGGLADMDGAAFHRAQTAALDRAVADALRSCGFLTVERAA